MIIGERELKQIIVTGENGEVLAVISDTEIINKNGVTVVLSN